MRIRVLRIGAELAGLIGCLVVLPAQAADVHGEIVTAATHAGLAAGASDVATVHMHLHHAINCLVGPQGTGFDSTNVNPCANSGNGAIPDTADPSKKKALQAAVDEAQTGLSASDLGTAQKDAADTSAMLKAVK